MCRFLAYKGNPIIMNDLLYQTQNSLIHQSYHALERQDPVNGDGFGIGWYMPDVDPEPALFVSIRPAWNNRNLRSLARRIRSGCVMAHVRAAGFGAVTEPNCHPFQYKQFLMMHNGDIGRFPALKRKMRSLLSDEMYNWIRGETDSEHFFALFLNHFLKKETTQMYEGIVKALTNAIIDLKEIREQFKIREHFYLNVVITDGNCLVASRYDTNPEIESPTLYYSEGSAYICRDGGCRMVKTDPSQHAVLIVSEKLTDSGEDWHPVPEQHLVVVTDQLHVSLLPVKV